MPGAAFADAFGAARLRRGLAAVLAAVLMVRVLVVRDLAVRVFAARVFGGTLLDGRLLRRTRDFDAMFSVIPAPTATWHAGRAGVTAAFAAFLGKAARW
jgi:hypothetical protein